jgi:MFS family permease
VRVVSSPIREFTPTGVRCADGSAHELDAVIFGTGFRASEFLSSMQVTGRVLEFAFASRLSASTVGILAMAFLPIALWVLSIAGVQWPLLVAFAVIYGIGNGAMTIVRGAIPAELFGRDAYGAINGAMAAPVTVAKAAGPLVAALLFAWLGGYDRTLLVLIAIGVISTAVFVVSTRASGRGRPTPFQ